MSEPKVVDFFFDYGSPFSYVADTQMAGLARRTGARVAYRPMLLGAILKATGNSSPMTIPAKAAYMGWELGRWAEILGIAFAPNPHPFLRNTLPFMRGAVASQRLGVFDRYHAAVFRAAWGEPEDLGDPATLARVLERAGVDRERLFATMDEAATKDELRRNTDEAVERGVFGAPAFVVDGRLYWGSDRLPWVEAALTGAEE